MEACFANDAMAACCSSLHRSSTSESLLKRQCLRMPPAPIRPATLQRKAEGSIRLAARNSATQPTSYRSVSQTCPWSMIVEITAYTSLKRNPIITRHDFNTPQKRASAECKANVVHVRIPHCLDERSLPEYCQKGICQH